jgi:hypothetical protein
MKCIACGIDLTPSTIDTIARDGCHWCGEALRGGPVTYQVAADAARGLARAKGAAVWIYENGAQWFVTRVRLAGVPVLQVQPDGQIVD